MRTPWHSAVYHSCHCWCSSKRISDHHLCSHIFSISCTGAGNWQGFMHQDWVCPTRVPCSQRCYPCCKGPLWWERYSHQQLAHSQTWVVAPSICTSGIPIQWSADRTKNAHITKVKDPTQSGNNQDYKSQICHYLDCADKCWVFNLATAVHDAGFDFRVHFGNADNNDSENNNNDDIFTKTSTLLENINPVFPLTETTQNVVDYFVHANLLSQQPYLTLLTLLWTFFTPQVTIHLTCNPKFRQMLVGDAT